MAEPAYVEGEPVFVRQARTFRTLLVVPMLKENEVVGVFAIYREEVRAFTHKQIELVSNFAAQGAGHPRGAGGGRISGSGKGPTTAGDDERLRKLFARHGTPLWAFRTKRQQAAPVSLISLRLRPA
jgi:GAF domain